MGRPKNFTRIDVLEKAIPVFWEHGLADTKIEHIEEATGVNKSGLYSEFKGKEEIFVESLRHYLSNKNLDDLRKEPLGWTNIRNFLRHSCSTGDNRGCFAIFTIREATIVPEEAHKLITGSRDYLTNLICANLKSEAVEKPEELASVIMTYFTGLSLQQNLNPRKTLAHRQIDRFLQGLM